MKTDRELLELAAKAAGLVPDGAFGKGLLVLDGERAYGFNPLSDDGDALRLAAKLKIDLEWIRDEDMVEAYIRDGEGGYYCPSYAADDYKRAIVDVAAHHQEAKEPA